MNALSRREEEALLKATKAAALKNCDPVVKAFADCASGRIISVAWACRDKLNEVQSCMIQFTGPEPMEKVQREYMRLRKEQQEKFSNISET